MQNTSILPTSAGARIRRDASMAGSATTQFRIATRCGAVVLLACLATVAAPATQGQDAGSLNKTALDRYVAKPDPSYGWKLHHKVEGDGFTAYVLDLTSQTWRTPDDVNRPVWKHWLTIIKPDNATINRAMLYIGGGDADDAAPTQFSDRSQRVPMMSMATQTNSVVAHLGMVPNQPLAFADSRRHGRYEDDLIAYSRVKYMMTGDEEWLVRLPMVKSGVKAMDAIQEFLASDEGGGLTVDEFVVSGASKRGWTTWLVGLMDDRVIGMIPQVIDALNTEPITRHHYESYGFFSPSLGDYVRHALYPHKLGSPELTAALQIEDPYMYRHRERMRIPKYVVNASGDQYFLPDNSQYYFADLPQEKHLCYVPNAKHNLAGSDASRSMIAYYDALIHDRERPSYSWQIREDDSIEARTTDRPIEVNLWQATNEKARDFRLDTIGRAWSSSPLAAWGDGVWEARVEKPDQGFTAFMIEFVFDVGSQDPLKVTTDIQVVPDVVPFAGAKMMPYLGKRPESKQAD